MKRSVKLDPSHQQYNRDFQQRSFFWLFSKRLVHESRKYTAGIILTAGITALFISMLVVGSSFLSASYRATGENGPRIFNISYPSQNIDITLEMDRNINVTCGISDFFPVNVARLYYSTDFMKTSYPLDGVLFASNLSGQFYRFTIEFGEYPEPKTYLFFLWANNSAGYFSYNDNGGAFYSIRLMVPEEGNPIDPQDPALLKLIQRLEIGIDNATSTRNPRPAVKVWINATSTAWFVMDNREIDRRSGARFYMFTPDIDLDEGAHNFTVFIQQGTKVYSKTINITRLVTPISLSNLFPSNNSIVYNQLHYINFTVNDWITCNLTMVGPLNKTWKMTKLTKNISIEQDFSSNFGNYSLIIQVLDAYGSMVSFYLKFNLSLSTYPYLYIHSPNNETILVNRTIMINMSVSETCNITIENLNITGSILSFTNCLSGCYSGMNLDLGWNYINITAVNSVGRSNSTILRLKQEPYIIRKYWHDPFVVPGGAFNICVNMSTNYTSTTNGTIWYDFDYQGAYATFANAFKFQGSNLSGVIDGLLNATVTVPLNVEDVLFNFTIYFGSIQIHFDKNGVDFHLPVDFLYQDRQGPAIKEQLVGPITNVYAGMGSITSNDKVGVRLNLFDVTGVKNVSIMYSLNLTFSVNSTLNMTFHAGSGYWIATIPTNVNGSTVYCRVMMYDTLNNSAMASFQYDVRDRLNQNLEGVIPGLLNPIYKEAITGAITTLLVIMVLIIIVFIVIFVALNDQNVKREMYREGDRIFILKHVCKLEPKAIRKYYYIEQLVQDIIGYAIGTILGFLVLGPIFVSILKFTLVAWTFDFQELFYFSFMTLESWVWLLLLLFVLFALLLKLVQVDKYAAKLVY